MEIEHIGDNKIRCALTEQEIESLGYDIDEIIANSEITQEFMHTVLELVEEQEHIQMEGISPMVKAELLQDHSMAITFGADKEVSLRDLVNTVSHMISQLDPDAASGKTAKAEEGNAQAAADTADTAAAAGTHKRTDPMICALRFSSFENMRRMSLLAFRGKIPKSSLYKMTHKHELPFFRPNGKIIYFEKSELLNWMRQNRSMSEAETKAAATKHMSELCK